MYNPELFQCYGYTGTPITALGNGTYVYPVSTGVIFGNTRTAKVNFWTPGDGTRGVTHVCFNRRQNIMCCTEKRLKVNLLVFSYPDKKPIQKITDVSKCQIAAMDFSRDGTSFALLREAPTFSMQLFRVDSHTNRFIPLYDQSATALHATSYLTFNPQSGMQLCSSGRSHILFWNYDSNGPTLRCTEGEVTRSNTRLTTHCWLPHGNVLGGTQAGEILSFDPNSGVGTTVFDGADAAVVKLIVVRHHVIAGFADGAIRFLDHETFGVSKTVHLPCSQLATFTLTPEYNEIYVGGSDGTLFIAALPGYDSPLMTAHEFDSMNPQVSVTADYTAGKVMGVKHMDDGSIVSFISEDGTLRLLDYKKNCLLSKIHVGSGNTCLDVGHMESKFKVLIGSSTGNLRVVDVSDPTSPKVCFKELITSGTPVTSVKVDASGAFALAVVQPDRLALFDLAAAGAAGAAGESTQLLGFLQLPPRTKQDISIVDAAWIDARSGFVVALSNAEVLHLAIPDPSTADKETFVMSNESVIVNGWRLDFPPETLALGAAYDEAFHVFVQSADKETKLYILDRSLNPDRKDRESKLCKPQLSLRDHDKLGTGVCIFQDSLMFTTAADGRVVVRDVAALVQPNPDVAKDAKREIVGQAVRHAPFDGGLHGLALSNDGKLLFTAGGDACLMVWGVGKGNASWETWAFTVMPQRELVEDADETEYFPLKCSHRAQEIDMVQNASFRQAVKDSVGRLTERLRDIRRLNDVAEEDEKVAIEDFLPERDRNTFEEQCEEATDKMREDVRFENLNRDYVTDIIQRQCWAVMQTKLQPVIGMKNAEMKVYNFHTPKPDPTQMALVRKLKFLRRVEQLEQQSRGVAVLQDIYESPAEVDAANDDNNGTSNGSPKQQAEDFDYAFEVPEGAKPRKPEDEFEDDIAPFLYEPLHVYTRQRCVSQMMMLHSKVANLKSGFNVKFKAVTERKRNDISRIKEKNARCRQVLKELEEQHELFQPALRQEEDPSNLFVVEDADVPADKANDPDEKKRLAAEQVERARWLRTHGNDDSSDRALKTWMDGKLEKEERVLVIKLQKPDFMDEKSDKFVVEEERNDEQLKAVRDYEKALAKKIEEVELRRKSLQHELATLCRENAATGDAFDAALQDLLEQRLQSSRHCSEVELQQIKLMQGVLVQGERHKLAKKMEQHYQALTDKLLQASRATKIVHDDLQGKKERLAKFQDEEKLKEKHMRSMPPFNEFSEDQVKLLQKYMKKKAMKERPKKDERQAKHKSKAGAQGESDVPTMDPFAFVEKEEEAKRRAQLSGDESTVLPRLDKPDNIPDAVWDAFQSYRQDRMDAERITKRLQEELDETSRECQRLAAIEEEIRANTEKAMREAHTFRHDSLREQYDLDQLFVFRQGQVEVEQQPVVTDYADALLIDTRRIQQLNELIRLSGQEKVGLMREINEKNKELKRIDWEIRDLVYQMGTLEMECRHLHTLRVTKQMQEFINGGSEDHNEKQRTKLLEKIDHVRLSMTAKIEERKSQMKRQRRLIKEKDMENALLMEQVGDAKTLVDDRRSIHNLQSSELDRERSNKLMKDMRVTRKLEDVAKAQQEEMIALKREIDRLRERTFPSFAVVSKRVVGNPDEL